jgi:hypothetical protein
MTVHIAVIGDYGAASPDEGDVAKLVKSWHPDLVITTGDNNYPSGSRDTIDINVGKYYHEFIAPYAGEYGTGAKRNRFFPTLGNHDWKDPGARAYLNYFALPGNERYYDVVWGPVHLFALDSVSKEPDGIGVTSRQAAWLHEGLANAAEPWKVVYLHYPPFSSGPHGPTRALQWPYGEWGATAVLAGHDHIYERILRDGIVYFVNGLGGNGKYTVGEAVEGSQARYDDDYGAMLIEANERQILFRFMTHAGQLVDSYTITRLQDHFRQHLDVCQAWPADGILHVPTQLQDSLADVVRLCSIPASPRPSRARPSLTRLLATEGHRYPAPRLQAVQLTPTA